MLATGLIFCKMGMECQREALSFVCWLCLLLFFHLVISYGTISNKGEQLSGASPETYGSGNLKSTNSQTSIHLKDVPPTIPLEAWHCTFPNNPRNWPQWKMAQILMLAFHSMAARFMADGIIPTCDTTAGVYNVTVPEASYLTYIQVTPPKDPCVLILSVETGCSHLLGQ